tara:strand:- start:254 stop:589 length:336 start_codon:yes stop_codon:yes gene_type:complete
MGQLAKGTRGKTWSKSISDASAPKGHDTYGRYEIKQDGRTDKKYTFRPSGSTNSKAEVVIDFSRSSSAQILTNAGNYDFDQMTIQQSIDNGENDLLAEMIYINKVKLDEQE